MQMARSIFKFWSNCVTFVMIKIIVLFYLSMEFCGKKPSQRSSKFWFVCNNCIANSKVLVLA